METMRNFRTYAKKHPIDYSLLSSLRGKNHQSPKIGKNIK